MINGNQTDQLTKSQFDVSFILKKFYIARVLLFLWRIGVERRNGRSKERATRSEIGRKEIKRGGK